MPPLVLDVIRADDLRDVVHRAVQSLAEGQLVAFPTETTYRLGASALHESAVLKLQSLVGNPQEAMSLAVKSAEEAVDFAPQMSSLGVRLARRCWPGPVTIAVEDHHKDSLINQLSPKVQQALLPAGLIHFCVPGHQTIQDVLRLLVGPIVLTNASRQLDRDYYTAAEMVAEFGDEIQLVLDDGRTRFAQPDTVVRVRGKELELIRAGVVPEKTLHRLANLQILFVCTGNTCRSPMAERLCAKLVADKLSCSVDELEERGVCIQSAGTTASMGGRAAKEAILILRESGLDLSQHASQPLNLPLAQHSDLILAMTAAHRQAILREWPFMSDRVHLVRADNRDIADPIGGTADDYRKCAEQIQESLKYWVDRLDL